MLQPQFKPHGLRHVLSRLFRVIPGHPPFGPRSPARCLRCAVVGNSGNLLGAGYGHTIDGHDFIMRWVHLESLGGRGEKAYMHVTTLPCPEHCPFPPRMNLAPTVGYENDAGSHTTHHFMYPESSRNLDPNVSFVLVPFKTLDLLWITSALSTGHISLCVLDTQGLMEGPVHSKTHTDLYICNECYHPSYKGFSFVFPLCFMQHLCSSEAVLAGGQEQGTYPIKQMLSDQK